MITNTGIALADTPAADLFIGTDAVDIVSYAGASRAVYADLSAGSAYHLLKVMPLGDSITYGVIGSTVDTESGGYRTYLQERLNADGVSVDFVGPMQNGPVDIDPDHAGFRGYTINQLDEIDSQLLAASKPDVVLLMAGTNDSAKDTSTTMIADLRSLIVSITDQDPNMVLFVASVPPVRVGQQSQTRADRVDAYNDKIPGLIADLAADGINVFFVDTRELTAADISAPPTDSGLHPNASGYSKITDSWLAALTEHLGLAQGVIGSDQDRFQSIEGVTGSSYDDVLLGDASANVFSGGAGDDHQDGEAGDDVLNGGAGHDLLTGGAGSDTLFGDAGSDVFFYGDAGSGGADRIADLDADDFIVTTAAFRDGNSDGIIAASRNGLFDLTAGGSVAVTSSTGAGVRSLEYDGVFAKGGVSFYVYSAVGSATDPSRAVSQFEGGAANINQTLNGTDGVDTFSGLDGNDRIFGRGGDDRLDGGTGDDLLVGGKGGDILTGGAGSDVFLYEGSGPGGRDRIGDFTADDFLFSTSTLPDGNGDRVIVAGRNGEFNFGDGSVAIEGSAGSSIRSLEFDGTVIQGDVTYYVYSLAGSSLDPAGAVDRL